MQTVSSGDRVVLERQSLDALFDALHGRGYRVIGPTVRAGAVVYDDLSTAADLPIGWTEEQQPGRYRLRPREDEAVFGFTVGPQSWKKYLHPPVLVVWRGRRDGEVFADAGTEEPGKPYAFIGVRPCELQAVAVQDRVFCRGPHVDVGYRARRDAAFLVAVNCGQAAATCFCSSMDAGPRAVSGFDLALTELIGPGGHAFLLEVGTERGKEVAAELPVRAASTEELEEAAAVSDRAAAQIGRSVDRHELRERLYQSYEHPEWDAVAGRCLACGNCTAVCPTCFCTTVEDTADLAREEAVRTRRWDSCFGLDFSYIHGGSVRTSVAARYRQWIIHKLAAWEDQFGLPGCVGCGRCITWCPSGIDLTEEVRALRRGGAGKEASDGHRDP